ncbi:Aste57867_18056 [Aphanomyces stellatus]|uniref:Aste57867_18056 protein n=1 Tax=Aphanomyces stellatus TaxID=120398 RepID=A0A485L9Z6_9STRA|nr:hypothetical protein As57867_017994 [Aphanomyces stellatus]VFT94795.1 Aste57867_18056 [Aphanomyces stellatus]
MKRPNGGRGKGWKPNEEQDLLICVGDITPVDTSGWDDVAIAFNFNRQRADRRTMESIKRKFKVLRNLTPQTAGLTNRQHVAEAKRLQVEMQKKKAALSGDVVPQESNALMHDANGHNAVVPPTVSALPPTASALDALHSDMLRPKQLAALGKKISSSRSNNLPPTRRQIMEALRDLDATTAVAAGDDQEAAAAERDADADIRADEDQPSTPLVPHASVRLMEPQAAPPFLRQTHYLPPQRQAAKRARGGPVDELGSSEHSMMSMLLMMEQSREKWMREMEERREAWEKEREERREALRLEREVRDRERDEFRDRMEARREERAAKHDQLMTLLLTKLLEK